MALTPEEEELYAVGASAVPKFLTTSPNETLAGFAKQFARVKAQIDYFADQLLIGNSEKPWSDFHAKGRGMTRQANGVNEETEEALRARIRTAPLCVTPDALIALANGILAADGVAGTVGYVELRPDRAHFGTYDEDGRARAYFSRGYRMTHDRASPGSDLAYPEAGRPVPEGGVPPTRRPPTSAIVIYPFGTPAATINAAQAAIDKARAGGFLHFFEQRGVP